MADKQNIMERYNNLDLYSKNVITECVWRIKHFNDKTIEETYKDIYYLSEQRADLIMCAIKALEAFNRVGGINGNEREKLLKFIELGEYFCMD